MKRRDLLKGGAAAAATAGAATLAAPAIAQQRIEVAMVATWPRDFPGLGTGAQRFAQRLIDISDGRFQVEYFAAGERVGAFDSFDEVASGNAQIYHAADYYWKGKHPAWAYFTAVPFGLTYTEMNAWIRFGGGQELWDELAADYGLKNLMCGNTGVQMGGWFRKEMNSADDFKGLKMRIPGLGGEVLRRAGGTPVTLPGSEIFTALQTGAIDATEWIGPYNDVSFGLHKAARYYYYPGWQEPGPNLEVIIHRKAWDGLPEDLREIVRLACQAVNLDSASDYAHGNAMSLAQLQQDPNVEIRPFPDDVLSLLRSLAREVVDELMADDPVAARIGKAYFDYLEKAQENSRITDHAYLLTRG
jgi:TRAP-type mannitol/chloroaromatic compound transport system substrate-binding protein